jgi:outer membrane lipoprotein carrier protein
MRFVRDLFPLFLLVSLTAVQASAADLIARIEQTYRKAPSLQAAFTQKTTIELLDKEETKQGKLSLIKGKFLIEYQTPQKQTYTYNGKKLWIYTPDFQEVEIYRKAGKQMNQEALSFLNGLRNISELFIVESISSLSKTVVLTLKPRDAHSVFQQLNLTFDSESLKIQEARLWPRRGNQTHYVFKKIKIDQKLDSSLFDFKIPQGVQARYPDA